MTIPILTPAPAGVAPITDWEVALVRERSPIADVVAEHIDLTDAGKGNLKGRCPFHKWKGSSSEDLYITPAHGFWYCYGCGDGGDVITFVRKLHGFGFHKALTLLAEQAGIRLGAVEVEELRAELTKMRKELERAVRVAEAGGPAAGMAVVAGMLPEAAAPLAAEGSR